MRDEAWLQQLLDDTWDSHFGDVPQDNIVRIRFGRKSKTRLGSIMVNPKEPDVSIITMNGLFRHEDVPDLVVKATLVHELSHYAHGFNSPLKQKFSKPHAGGVMRREYAERGLLELYLTQKRWLKFHWIEILQKHYPECLTKKRAYKRVAEIPKPFWFIG